MVDVVQSRIVEGTEGQLSGCDLGEQPYPFGHGCLEGSTVRRVCKAVYRQRLAKGEKLRAKGSLKADIMAGKRPSMVHVAIDSGEGEGKDAPYQGIVKDGDVVGNCHESLLARLVFRSRLEKVEEPWQSVDFSFVEAEKEQSGQGGNDEECLV